MSNESKGYKLKPLISQDDWLLRLSQFRDSANLNTGVEPSGVMDSAVDVLSQVTEAPDIVVPAMVQLLANNCQHGRESHVSE